MPERRTGALLVALLLTASILPACAPAPAVPTPTSGPTQAPPVLQADPTPAAPRIDPTVPAPAVPTPPPEATPQPTVARKPDPAPAAAATDPGLPLRSAPEAIAAHSRRLAAARPAADQSDLERLLGRRLADSKVGFVNGHHLLETELREPGHLSYAVNPVYNEATNGLQRFLVFGNSPNFLNYRGGALDDALLQSSDRAIWAASNGYRVATVIQVDNDLSDNLIRQIVASRAKAGLRIFVVGNEFNDPGAHWRYNLPRLLRATEVARATLEDLNVEGAEVYTPALAYLESSKHLDALLAHYRANARTFPATGIAENYYGPVEGIRDHFAATRAVLEKHRLANLPVRVGELGNPADTVHQPFADEQLAYNYFPQAIALTLSSEVVGTLDVFAVFHFDRSHFSLAALEGTALRPKTSLLATRLAARVFSRVRSVDYRRDGDVHRVTVRRDDGRRVWVVWSSSDTRELKIARPDDSELFGALGNRLDEDEITLTPRPHPALAGTAKYVVLDD